MEIFINEKWIEFNKELLNIIKNKLTYNGVKISTKTLMRFVCSCGEKVNKDYTQMKRRNFETMCRKCLLNSRLNYDEIFKKVKKTNLERYGVENPNVFGSEKYKNIIKEKYGVENVSQLEVIKEKIKQTNIERYNVSSVLKNRSKKEEGMINKYGVKSPLQSDIIKNKQKQTNLKKYGVTHISQAKEVKSAKLYKRNLQAITHIKYRIDGVVKPLFDLEDLKKVGYYDSLFRWQCCTCSTSFEDYLYSGHIPRCPICYPKNQPTSNLEKEVVDYIKFLNVKNVITNDKTILNPHELDIYLPDYNLAIEFNGLYWHSELQGKDKNYHLNKTKNCLEKNIQLIHIFEDEWLEKKDIVKSIIKIKLGIGIQKIYARKCIIKEVNDASNFLNINHIQGYTPAKVEIGLYHEEELISLLTFSKSRFDDKYDWEIIRYVNKLGVSVIGGFSKMLKNFRKNYSGSIVTYSDRRYFNGNVYESNGFVRLKDSKPSFYVTNYKNRFNRQQFQKHKLNDKLEVFNPNLTAWENIQLNGWDRIWDCGTYKFVLSGELD